ncbi:MAG: ComEC/Rec2 family competence protein [Bacteroidota bacterium]|nr:ComEC/Rec2 family competence protein [Bacteroidota bacterium]
MKKFLADKPIIFPLVFLIVIIILFDCFCPTIFLRNHYIKHFDQRTNLCKYVIETAPKLTKEGKHYGYVANMIAIKNNDKWTTTTGEVQIYLSVKDSNKIDYPLLKMGDTIVAKTYLRQIENFTNSFDYIRYMKHKRIYHQTFLKDFSIHRRNKATNIRLLAFDINSKLKNIILKSPMEKEKKALAIAMLLGDKTTLQKDTRQMFNHSGLAHILCVSGLHVMIIISFFDFLLGFVVSKNLRGFYLRRILLVLLTWALAFVVGLTPACVRVAVMSSLFLLATLSKKEYDNMNILFVTAFIFLLIDPLLLFNISFQLSFLAVFGIFAFKPFILTQLNKLFFLVFKPNSRIQAISNPIFQNISISLATQICCLPILIVNFGYFPLFFLLANILAIPLAQIILVSIIIYLPLSSLPFISMVVSKILDIELSLLLFIGQQTEKLNNMFF